MFALVFLFPLLLSVSFSYFVFFQWVGYFLRAGQFGRERQVVLCVRTKKGVMRMDDLEYLIV